MTIKEESAEMLEMFRSKTALSDKINHNAKELLKIDVELRKIESALKYGEGNTVDLKEKTVLKRKRTVGNKLIAGQIKDRSKLTYASIAASLGFNKSFVSRRYQVFIDSILIN